MPYRNITKLTKETLKIIGKKVKEIKHLKPGSIDFRVAVEELQDGVILLLSGFSDDTITQVLNETTDERLYDLLRFSNRRA